MNFLCKIILIAICLLSACTTSNLYPTGVKPEVIALANSNTREIIIKVTNSFNLESLGHQYLAILFPMGEIRHESLEQTLMQKLYTELAQRGYRPRIDVVRDYRNMETDELTVDLANIQLTAYDLLMTRKVVSKVKLRGEYDSLRVNIPLTYTISSAYSEYKTMPFQAQLQRILEKSIESSVRDLLNQLRLQPNLINNEE